MKTAEEIANDLCNEFADSDIGDCWGLISKVIRAAQIDAAEWMREEAAKVALNPEFIAARDTEWDDGVNYAKRAVERAIRSIKLPGGGE